LSIVNRQLSIKEMEHVTFDRMPHALGLLLDRLEALRAEVAELRAAVSPPPAKGGGGGEGGPGGGLMAFSEACAYLGVRASCRS